MIQSNNHFRAIERFDLLRSTLSRSRLGDLRRRSHLEERSVGRVKSHELHQDAEAGGADRDASAEQPY